MLVLLRLFGLLCTLLCVSGTALADQPILDRVVASVNGEAISESDLKMRTKLLMMHLNPEMSLPPIEVLQKQLLEKMILEKLQWELATPDDLNIDAATLDAQIADMAAHDGLSKEDFEASIKDQEIPVEKFRSWVKMEMILAKVQQREVASFIHISKKDIEAFLASPAGQEHRGTEYHLGHILIAMPEPPEASAVDKARHEAESIVKALKAGADFAKMAMEKSADAQALEGGDLGWHPAGSVPTLFSKLLPSLKIHEVRGPIIDRSGFHIIKLLGLRESSDDIRTQQEKAAEALYRRQFETQLMRWLKQLRNDADIEIIHP